MKNFRKRMFVNWRDVISNILEGSFPISLVFYLIISNGKLGEKYLVLTVIFFVIMSIIVSINWDEVRNRLDARKRKLTKLD